MYNSAAGPIVMLIAPLSCNTLAKMANGICDNLLLATYLSAACPVVVAPAMDEDMWLHPATKANIEKLQSFGNRVIPVEKGELASGLYGDGRMAEPEQIISFLEMNFFFSTELKGKKHWSPRARPTNPLTLSLYRQPVDRKNGSRHCPRTGTRGAEVELVLGPSSIEIR